MLRLFVVLALLLPASASAKLARDFTCKSSTSGLRCKNRSGHGFFLSGQRSCRF